MLKLKILKQSIGKAIPSPREFCLDVPTKPGIGVEVNMKMLENVTVKKFDC